MVYGGRSGEHEISLRSAASVIRFLDRSRFEVIPIGIDKEGKWYFNDLKLLGNIDASLPLLKDAPSIQVPVHPVGQGAEFPTSSGKKFSVDVIFPVVHGPLCEDGTLQGLLELAEIPYVGSGVLGSAIGMDKEVSKRLARDSGIPVAPFITVKPQQWKKSRDSIREQVARQLGFPCFVKPSNMGSSVGVHKVKKAADLDVAMEDAFRYDVKVLIERGINGREIELSVLENLSEGEAPLVSIPGEIIPHHEFYSYEAKYLDENGAGLEIPAKLTDQQIKTCQKLARDVFGALELEGMARVDMFLDRDTGTFYLNEVNTIPGFTSISMYPKLWEASGVTYAELLSKLVDLALARYDRRKKLLREYEGAE